VPEVTDNIKPWNQYRVVTDRGPEWIRAHYCIAADGELLFYEEDDSGAESIVAAFASGCWESMQKADPEVER
jgi:hypothetical protein